VIQREYLRNSKLASGISRMIFKEIQITGPIMLKVHMTVRLS